MFASRLKSSRLRRVRFAEPSVNQNSLAVRSATSLVWNCSPCVRNQRTLMAPSEAAASSLATERFGMPFLVRAERVLVGIEDHAHGHAALRGRDQRLDHARAPTDRTSRCRCCRRRACRRHCARSRRGSRLRSAPGRARSTQAMPASAGTAAGAGHSPFQPDSRASASSLSSSGVERAAGKLAARRSNAGCWRRADWPR